MDERERIYRQLVETIVKMGYPEGFGIAIAENLRTEKTMSRMLGYLRAAKPKTTEEIADEMLAIMDLRDHIKNKHISEHAQASINKLYRDINEE